MILQACREAKECRHIVPGCICDGDPTQEYTVCQQCGCSFNGDDVLSRCADHLQPYVSTSAKQFAPGNFVRTWNPDLGRDAIGVTRAVADVQEANPLILVKWMHDLSEEWVRSEYLYLCAA